MPTTRSYSTHEAAAAAGVTYRQADYWARIGTVGPSIPATGSGSRRQYSALDVGRLAVVGRLAALSIPPSGLDLDALTDPPPQAWRHGYLVVTVAQPGVAYETRLALDGLRLEPGDAVAVVLDLGSLALDLELALGEDLGAAIPHPVPVAV